MAKAYFFMKGQYVRYTMDPGSEGVDAGYPKPIKGHWKGLAEAYPLRVDAGVVWNNGKAYFFLNGSGDTYVRYTMDPSREGVDAGYPKPIRGNWKGLKEALFQIDAAVVWPNGKAYFFGLDQYVQYTMDPANEGVDAGYPKPIKGHWKGLAEALPMGGTGVDSIAAVVWNNGKAYFFQRDQYVQYTMDPANEGVDAGYPKPIKGHWKGLAEAFPDGIQTAVVWP